MPCVLWDSIWGVYPPASKDTKLVIVGGDLAAKTGESHQDYELTDEQIYALRQGTQDEARPKGERVSG